MTNILGIDPGSTRIGFAIVNFNQGNAKCLKFGIINNEKMERDQALKKTEVELRKLIKQFSPEFASIEKIFFANNQKTAISVSEFRGVILLTLAKLNIPVSEYTPMEVKKFITGYGGAKKPQIQKIIQLILKMDEPIVPDDAADAVAIALCHPH